MITKREILNSINPISRNFKLRINGKSTVYKVTRMGVGHLETKHGVFLLYHFDVNDNWKEYNVLVKSETGKDFQPLFKNEPIHIRIDSGCLTGHIFDDQTCECRAQLYKSMKEINELGEGVIVCIPKQDGRGMGIPFKLATLSLQHCLDYDTVKAAKAVAKSDIIDKRDYFGAIAVLKFFGIHEGVKIDLFTNNPSKIKAFELNNYLPVERHKLVIRATKFTKKHLFAKQKYLGHMGLVGKDWEAKN
jgi:3,4-dihydroxy 2-butanone 4-phosphate synthase/GTP cyclohydrolase II